MKIPLHHHQSHPLKMGIPGRRNVDFRWDGHDGVAMVLLVITCYRYIIIVVLYHYKYIYIHIIYIYTLYNIRIIYTLYIIYMYTYTHCYI